MEEIPEEAAINRNSQNELLINNKDANPSAPQEDIDEYYESIKNSKFKQQTVPAWRPKPTIYSTTVTFVTFGVIFIFIGIFVISFSNKVFETTLEYSSTCKDFGKTCSMTLILEKDIKDTPIMIFYQIDNFYQNHRKYVSSRNDLQLNGDNLPTSDLSECAPLVTNAEMNKHKSVNGNDLNPNDPAIPCGLFAYTYFNDTFKILDKDSNPVDIDEKGIAWNADVKKKYKNTGEGWEGRQWLDMTDEHFLVWMRPSAFPTFRKLWGKIKKPLTKGNYTIKIENNYDVNVFEGKKSVVISTINIFGGKNDFLGISYLVVGSACIVVAVVWVLAYRFYQGKNQERENNIDNI